MTKRTAIPRRARAFFIFPIAALLLSAVPSASADTIAHAEPFGERLTTYTRVIDRFEVGSEATRFGSFEFRGGLEVTSDSRLLSGMSSIRLSDDRLSFLGVMDTGYWFSGRFERDDGGRLSGVHDFRIAPILGPDGQRFRSKWESDAEALAVKDGDVLVGFEREHRIAVYPEANPQGSAPVDTPGLLIPLKELRTNRGIETVAVSPDDGPLAGARVAVSEKSINPAGDLFASILDGPKAGVFFVHRDPPFDVSDGDFLPNGDLLLLERSFTMAEGLGMRIVRIDASSIRPGATVKGRVVMTANFGDQIDNMEGLSISRDAAGNVDVLLVSDDNASILQRNLFLEFRLIE